MDICKKKLHVTVAVYIYNKMLYIYIKYTAMF